MALGST